jgi:hypothetical protein
MNRRTVLNVSYSCIGLALVLGTTAFAGPAAVPAAMPAPPLDPNARITALEARVSALEAKVNALTAPPPPPPAPTPTPTSTGSPGPAPDARCVGWNWGTNCDPNPPPHDWHCKGAPKFVMKICP